MDCCLRECHGLYIIKRLTFTHDAPKKERQTTCYIQPQTPSTVREQHIITQIISRSLVPPPPRQHHLLLITTSRPSPTNPPPILPIPLPCPPLPSTATDYVSALRNSPAISLLLSRLLSFARLSASSSGMLLALSVAPLGTRTSLGSGMAMGVGAARMRSGARRVRRREARSAVRMVG